MTTAQIDFGTISSAEQFITEDGLRNSAAKLLPAGTVLLAMYGQGKTRGKVAILGIEAATNQACAAIATGAQLDSDYLFHWLAGHYEALRSVSNAGSQENLSGRLVRKFPVSLPPLPEQRAIAAALSDVDALIAGLDRLIAKKRDLKQAAMQQLLTGQTRLPGFSGELETKALREAIGALQAGVSVNSVTGEWSRDGTARVLKTSCVSAGQFLPREAKEIAQDDLRRATISPRAGTLIVSRMNTTELVGECGYVDVDCTLLYLPDRLWMATCRRDEVTSMKWLSYVLSTEHVRDRIRSAATGTSGSMKNLSKQAFLSIEIVFPQVDEQRAIAAVLTDMDAEITALEARRDKTRLIKQGMMQELLTGRTRLV